jgi:hypothetical protein
MLSNIINTDIEMYTDRNRLLREAFSYIGQPKQSTSEPDKIFLRLDPLLNNGAVLEFKTNDIVFAEHIETIADSAGETFQIYKVWVRVGSIGVKLEHFTV